MTKAGSSLLASLAAIFLAIPTVATAQPKTGAAEGQPAHKSVCSVSGTTSQGRHINGEGDIPLGITIRGETAAINLGTFNLVADKLVPDHTLTFAAEKLLLDGRELAKFPTSATAFGVVCKDGKLQVVIDKKKVLDVKLGKPGAVWVIEGGAT